MRIYRLLVFSLLFIAGAMMSPYAFGQVEPTTADTTVVEYEEDEKEFDGPDDSTAVKSQHFDSLTLSQLRSDPNLNYKQPPTVMESLWDRIKRWIAQLILMLLQGATSTNLGKILLYAGGIIILSIIVMMLLKVNALNVFYSGSSKGTMASTGFHENIHEMDFEKLLAEAVGREEYRMATRLILLYALRILTDKSIIHWQAGKTNHDYVDELPVGDIKTGLNEISFYFEYAWYGNFSVTRETYAKVEHAFNAWRQKVI